MDQNEENKIKQTTTQEELTGQKAQPETGQDGGEASGKRDVPPLRQQLGQARTVCFVIAFCIFLYFVLLRIDDIAVFIREIFDILRPIIYGLAIAYMLNPIVKFVDRHLYPVLHKWIHNEAKVRGLCRPIGIIAALALLIFAIIGLCNMILPELLRSISNLIRTLPVQLSNAVDMISNALSKDTALNRALAQALEEATSYLLNWIRTDLLDQVNVLMTSLTEGVVNIASGLFNALIGIIVSIYVLWGKEKFAQQGKKMIYAAFRSDRANMILHVAGKSNEIFNGFIVGKLIDSLIIGVLCFIGLSIIDMPYTMLVSVIVGVTNIIPFFGPYIGAIPSAILILLADPIKGIYFIVFIIILQQIDGNIIGPKILGNSTGLSAFWVIVAILLGGGLFGLPGMILGVPTFAVIYYLIGIVVNHMLGKKQLPTETTAYSPSGSVDDHGNYVYKKTENGREEVKPDEEVKKNKGEE